jgi:hypothetical protein
MSTAEAS